MEHFIGTILTLGYSAVFLFLISRMRFFRVGSISVKWFQAVFVLKILSGFFLYLIYTYYYTDRSTADIWKYYDDGMILFSALRECPMDYVQMLFGIDCHSERFQAYYDVMANWCRPNGGGVGNDTHTIIRFNAFVRLVSLGYYNVHSVVMNFLGLVGLTGILHFLRQLSPQKEKWFFAGVFLMPGMMFWASGVLKEPLLLFGLGLFLYGVMQLSLSGFSIGRVILVLLSLFFLLTAKAFVLAAIVAGLICLEICKRVPKIHPALVFGFIHLIGVVVVVSIGKAFPDKDVLARLAKKQHEFYKLVQGGTYVETNEADTLYIGAEYFDALTFSQDRKTLVLNDDVEAVFWENANMENQPSLKMESGTTVHVLLDYGRTGSSIATPRLDNSVSSFVKALPMALVNATFRPFPWNIRSPFMLLSGLENMIILLLLVLAIFGAWKRRAFPNTPIFYLALSFALVILILTGLVTPVVGAIVRYKVPALPFLVCALLTMIDTEGLENVLSNRFPSIKKYT